jgi:hypothetical protein
MEALNGSVFDIGVVVHQRWFQNVLGHGSWQSGDEELDGLGVANGVIGFSC